MQIKVHNFLADKVVLSSLTLSFQSRVQEYESIYKAKAAVASFPSAPMQRVVSRRKRDDEDEDSRFILTRSRSCTL